MHGYEHCTLVGIYYRTKRVRQKIAVKEEGWGGGVSKVKLWISNVHWGPEGLGIRLQVVEREWLPPSNAGGGGVGHIGKYKYLRN